MGLQKNTKLKQTPQIPSSSQMGAGGSASPSDKNVYIFCHMGWTWLGLLSRHLLSGPKTAAQDQDSCAPQVEMELEVGMEMGMGMEGGPSIRRGYLGKAGTGKCRVSIVVRLVTATALGENRDTLRKKMVDII